MYTTLRRYQKTPRGHCPKSCGGVSSPTAPTAARRRASSRFRRAAATFRPSGKGSGVSLASTSSATPKRLGVWNDGSCVGDHAES